MAEHAGPVESAVVRSVSGEGGLDLRRYMELSPDLFCVASVEGVFLWLNAAWERMLGWSAEELLSRPCVDFVHPDDVEATARRMSGLAEGLPVFGFENRYRHRDGGWRWLQWSAMPDGAVVVACARDVTRRREALEAAEERLRLLRLSEELAQVGVWRVEVESGRVAWSPGVYRIHGMDPRAPQPSVEEALSFYGEEDRVWVERHLRDAVAEGRDFRFERGLVRADGGERRVECIGRCRVDASGRVEALEGAFRDVTLARRRERDLAEQVERAQRFSARLRAVTALTTAAFGSLEELHAAHLEAGCEVLGMEVGLVGGIDEDRLTVLSLRGAAAELALGDVLPLADTPWREVAERGVFSAGAGDSAPAAGPLARHRAALAAPLRVEGTVVGLIAFLGREPRAGELEDGDREFLELLAASIGRETERDGRVREQRRVLEDLERSRETFEGAFQSAGIGMAIVGLDGRWLQVNPALCDILGRSESDLLATDFQSLTHPEDLDSDVELLRETLAGRRDTYQLEKRYYHRSGRVVHTLLTVALVRGAYRQPLYFVSQVQDVTREHAAREQVARQARELEDMNRRLRELSETDELTGLANRRALERRLREELERSVRHGTPVAVVLGDVDRFKGFNDDFGHAAGDAALRRLGGLLRAAVRGCDLVGRWGGEEFLAVLPETDGPGAAALAERLREAVARADWELRPVTVSFGVASLRPPAGAEAVAPCRRRLLEAADRALYDAKAAGRDAVRSAPAS